MTQVSLRRDILHWLARQPRGEFVGPLSIEGYEADDVLDEVFRMERERLVTGRFPPNPNRRQGSDFGIVKLTPGGIAEVPPWMRHTDLQ